MARKSVTLVKVGPVVNKVADGVEKPRGIVVGEKRGGIEASGAGARQGGRIDEGAGGVVGAAAAAVGSVGIGGERGDAIRAIEVDRKRQGIFLVRAAAALARAGSR